MVYYVQKNDHFIYKQGSKAGRLMPQKACAPPAGEVMLR